MRWQKRRNVPKVLQILSPLEEGHCDSACVGVDVRQHADGAVSEDHVCFWQRWAVGSLRNVLAVQPPGNRVCTTQHHVAIPVKPCVAGAVYSSILSTHRACRHTDKWGVDRTDQT